MPVCTQCHQNFEFTDEDRAFFKKVSPVFQGKKYELPATALCQSCNFQNQLSFRDERGLYKRKCDAMGQDMISIYSPDKPYKVYSVDYWYSDHWDPLEYGRDFDFGRPFFEQFAELSLAVPKLQYSAFSNENCPFMNRCCYCRNCYLCINMEHGEDCYYCGAGYKMKNCADCDFSPQMELCSECVSCKECYGSRYLVQCSNLSDSAFCFDCHGSSDLILCWNLQQKRYCILNQQYSKEEFLEKKAQMQLSKHSSRVKYVALLRQKMQSEAIHKYANILKSQDSCGNNIFESKNCPDCFDIFQGEDLRRVVWVDYRAKDASDSSYVWNSELVYNSTSVSGHTVALSFNIWECSNVLYSELCKSSHYLFGCASLHNKRYCILNKQYTRQDYEALVPKIIEHMKKTRLPPAYRPPAGRAGTGRDGQAGEWGQFFPKSISSFGYNESLAQEYFPLSKQEALERSYKWSDYQPPVLESKKLIPASELPDDIADVPDDIVESTIQCEKTGKQFQIISQELAFYRRMGLPLPRRCPNQRHLDRLALRNPRRLWDRTCSACNANIRTSYSTEKLERVYCEGCYLSTVY